MVIMVWPLLFTFSVMLLCYCLARARSHASSPWMTLVTSHNLIPRWCCLDLHLLACFPILCILHWELDLVWWSLVCKLYSIVSLHVGFCWWKLLPLYLLSLKSDAHYSEAKAEEDVSLRCKLSDSWEEKWSIHFLYLQLFCMWLKENIGIMSALRCSRIWFPNPPGVRS